MRKLHLWILLLIFIPAVTAQTLENYTIDFIVQEETANATYYYHFNQATITDLVLYFPEDAEDVKVVIDGMPTTVEVIHNSPKHITLPLTETTKDVILSFTTKSIIENNNDMDFFVADIEVPLDTAYYSLNLYLPEGTGMAEENSAFLKPEPQKIQEVPQTVHWSKEHISQGKTYSYIVMFEEKTKILLQRMVVIGVLLLVPIAQITYIIYYRKKKKQEFEAIYTKKVKKGYPIEDHLKEDEQQIINVLRNKENFCNQGTLAFITGFSKSALSRYLIELEARNVLIRKKEGKKNIVMLNENFRDKGGAEA